MHLRHLLSDSRATAPVPMESWSVQMHFLAEIKTSLSLFFVLKVKFQGVQMFCYVSENAAAGGPLQGELSFQRIDQ